MRKAILTAAVCAATILIPLRMQAQTLMLSGTVTDENALPLEFVNAVLLSLPDSTFVQGAVTDAQGHFSLPATDEGMLLRLTAIGYETRFLPTADIAGQTIEMKEETQMLSEIVVKSRLPRTLVKGDAMRTTVAGTILEKAGTVADMLNKVPSLEAERGGAVKVLGRGDAEVYINGRRIHDMRELTQLQADQIQHIDVVQNPGARYTATTKAVVRIQLKKAQGDGFSVQDYVSGIYQYSYTLTNDLTLNYRTGGLDIKASLWAGRYGHQKSLQSNTLTYFAGPDLMEAISHQESKNIWKGWSPQLQVNYMVDENHSFGAFYKYDRHPGSDYRGCINTHTYTNGTFTEHSQSDIWRDDAFTKHIFNAYLNGNIGKLGIDLNIDGLFDNTAMPNTTAETTSRPDGSSMANSIESETNSSNHFWASKLILTYPICKGNLSVGGEYTHNSRNDAYSYIASTSLPVKATDTEINESATAAFAEFSRTFGKVFTQVGLRYEHLTNDFQNFGKRQEESCRSYSDWFPTATVSMPIGNLQLSLSYRRDIQRPNYGDLTSSTVYINRYTFQSGNPYLRPTYTHSLVLNGAYKWANLSVIYTRTKDAETMSTEPYPDSDDPLVSLLHPINSDEAYNQLTIIPSLRPVIGCWHPVWSIVTMFQNYKTPCADGSILTLNHPVVFFLWQNDWELPHNIRLNATMQWVTKGDYNNFRISDTRFFTAIGAQHDINLRQLGALTIAMRCTDLLHTNKTSATIYGPRELTSTNPARRSFMLDLTWKFNEARSKYRGTGAGDKQKARM